MQPSDRYDLVVIGGGTAGLVCAAGAAGLGARVALIERHRLGGECLYTGCVPSKALLAAAREGSDFDVAMSRVRSAIASLAPHDSPERMARLGIEVVIGDAAFRSPTEIVVRERVLRFRRAVVATGSRAAVPDIPGLAGSPCLTNESLFSIARQPRSLAILGGGAMGCEMAQAFARLGTRVTLIEAAPRVLPAEDPDASAVIARSLEADGIAIVTNARVSSISHGSEFAVEVAGLRVSSEALLIAAGRRANVEGLQLDRAGIACDARGIAVDDRLRTTNPRVYASGDVCTSSRFTHAADAMSRIVLENALFFRRRRASRLLIPSCTFTAPEVAHVGIRADAARSAGMQDVTVALDGVDRAVIDGQGAGFVRVHHTKGRIRGVTIVAPHAGELIGAVALLIRRGGTLGELSSTIFPYPTIGTALRQAGDAFRRESLTPRVRALLRAYFGVLR